MISFACRLTLVLVLVALAGVGSAAAQCEPSAGMQFLCGPRNPEDLLSIPDSPWILVSSLAATGTDGGELLVADARDHSTGVVFPSPAASSRHDQTTYGSCPGELASGFGPHGLSLRSGENGVHTLYVVRHGGREAIEVFELDMSPPMPALTWVGCAPAPEGVSFNSVAALPEGRFAATNFRLGAGELWEWGSDTGWTKVPGSETSGPNGLVASADGRWLFIGGWGTESVIRLSRGSTPIQTDSVAVGFHVDNLRWTSDGSLLAAGQSGAAFAVGTCLQGGSCAGVATGVARIDPLEMTAEEILRHPSDDKLIMGTVAIEVGEEIWIGAIAGGTRIGRIPVR